MGKTSYYFAVSLDGYIARPEEGRVDWLDPFFEPLGTPYDFEPFMETVDAIVMGRKTYEIGRSLGPLPLGGKPGFVYSRQESYEISGAVRLVTADVAGHVRELKSKHQRRIWVLGGGILAAFLLEEGLLDEVILTIVPVTIGGGIRWLGASGTDAAWHLEDHFVAKNGVAQLVYSISG